MNKIRFKVSKYALFDVLSAFENENDKYIRIEYSVSKEDDDLVVFAEEKIKENISNENCTDWSD
jgi:hypothetical protein